MAMAGVGPGGSDSSIRDDVQFELKWDPRMTSNTYQLELHNWASAEGELRDSGVTAKDGVLTLSGYVSSYWEKDAAEKAAKRVCGMRAVANDLQIRLSYSRTDPEIAKDAVHELESHIRIPSEKIKATVKDGWVTLEGAVDWQLSRGSRRISSEEAEGSPRRVSRRAVVNRGSRGAPFNSRQTCWWIAFLSPIDFFGETRGKVSWRKQ
jgi:osmotically-inducible protein OsmY